jgi:FemAB-related protein (PEP-CTERM system-associated)
MLESRAMRIAVIDDADAARWDAYVTPRTTTVTDLYAWRRVVRGAYGMRSHFLVAEEGGRIAGALALFEVRHPLLGHYLATAPFGNDGGLHHDGPEARARLLDEARRIADLLRVSYLLVRTRGEELEGFAVDRRYTTAAVDLGGSAGALWSGLPGKTRNQVRRGQKEGFVIASGADQIEPFHRVFHAHMRALGSPAHALGFYRGIARELGSRARFIVVRDGEGGAVAAGALLFTVNGTATNHHTVALGAYNRRCPNYMLYWHMLSASADAGCHTFDMGRSVDGTGNLRFKENWGPRLVKLTSNYYLRTLRAPPFTDPRNPRYRLPMAVWRRLPLPVTRVLGPRLITGLV